MIERTIYAASVDETRYNLNGVYFETPSDTQKIRMVATDGHRLVKIKNHKIKERYVAALQFSGRWTS